MYLRLVDFVVVPDFFPFSCVSSILEYNNKQGKPGWIFKVNYCGEVFLEVLFPWEISETIWISKYKKRPQNYL